MNECPKCKSEYHAGDTECQKCGIIFAKFEQYQAKQNLTNVTSQQKKPSLIVSGEGRFLIFCVLLVVYLVYAEFTGMAKSPQPKASRDLTTMAFIQCQDLVKGELISPSTADFPSFDFESNIAPDDLYIIRSYVDSQNGFGATIRTRWRCKVRYIGGDEAAPSSWRLVDLQMYKR